MRGTRLRVATQSSSIIGSSSLSSSSLSPSPAGTFSSPPTSDSLSFCSASLSMVISVLLMSCVMERRLWRRFCTILDLILLRYESGFSFERMCAFFAQNDSLTRNSVAQLLRNFSKTGNARSIWCSTTLNMKILQKNENFSYRSVQFSKRQRLL